MSKTVSLQLKSQLKTKLENQEKSLIKRIENLKKEDPFADPDHASDNAAVDTDVREKVGHETIEAQVNTLSRILESVRHALVKMNKGKYGICERCGNPILIERLKFLPEVRYCVDCEKLLVK